MSYYVYYLASDVVTNVSKAMVKLVVSLAERMLMRIIGKVRQKNLEKSWLQCACHYALGKPTMAGTIITIMVTADAG
jgi:hypothetical protein